MIIERVLAIETSCDDTSVAVVRNLPGACSAWVESLVSANQDLAHAPFGGVVPEIASRNHTLHLLPLVEEALRKASCSWEKIHGIAVTNRPGLVGSLIVGLIAGKSIAQAKKIPLLGVNHLEGHILAPFLHDTDFTPAEDVGFPFLALAVSGGHTSIYLAHAFGKYEILGSTLDDAAGEAFDKFGKMLGLGFPGGVKVDQLSQQGDKDAYAFPRALIREESYAMSFSGLKASAQRLLEKMSENEKKEKQANLCASFQCAIVDVLLAKFDRAVKQTKIKNVVITGGVSANSYLRSESATWAKKNKLHLLVPPLRFCTDNAAMIGLVGVKRLRLGEASSLSIGPSPSSWPQDFLGLGVSS
jgi:N6-L-threonylcarbamoyladenine synthase